MKLTDIVNVIRTEPKREKAAAVFIDVAMGACEKIRLDN
jgi:hypothetical protein